MTDRVGQQLGNYRLQRLLGRGGQASVYLGEHTYLHKPAALKLLHLRLGEPETDQFLHEAQTLARLDHPHIVRVLDFAVQEGIPYLVMDYAVGGTLRTKHPAGTRVPLEQILTYVSQVASAVQYAHDQRLIHRDVKPENMLLDAREHVLLADFGLALLTPTRSASTQAMDPTMAGTAPYLAPEQVQGQPRAASDQYALGVVVYEWLSGQRPFKGTPIEVALQHVQASPPPLREHLPDLPPEVEEVIMRALAKTPEQRFPSVQDFATALENAFQKAVSLRFTPVLAPHHAAETGHRPSSIHDLPQGTVTLLFTDMEGSTQLLQQLGERYAEVLAVCRHLLRAAFGHWSGHEIDTQGDAFFVAFARASDAISAAVEAQRVLASHSWPEDAQIRVRIGLHTGEPTLSSEGYVGLDVHRAARIMSAGHGGQVLLSQATSMLVEPDLPEHVSLRDLGEHRLKDLRGPHRLFQLVIADLQADFPPLKTLESHSNNLPAQLTSLLGREQDVEAVEHLLRYEDVRLLTLTGPGGIGKTRLAIQIASDLADEFVDGVSFISLAPVTDPDLVLPTIAQTLAIKEREGLALLEVVQQFLRDKHLLLLLDNFEQIMAAAPHVEHLLSHCPQLMVLVTSRAVLRIPGEQVFPVAPLAVPDLSQDLAPEGIAQSASVALFMQRAHSLLPSFQLTAANARAIAELCIRLDGLPLAIELAAARVRLLPPQALLSRLSQRLHLLIGGPRTLPARQQTLRKTIQWSYDLLSPEEQALFRRLTVCAGGWALEAAEALSQGTGTANPDVLNTLASLLDHSLIQQWEQEAEEPRYQMLQTLREYGLELLADTGELQATQAAHAHFFLRLSEQAEPELKGPNQAVWVGRLEQEHDNLRAALEWALEDVAGEQTVERREIALRLSAALWPFWSMRGHYSEARTELSRALARSEGASISLRVKVLQADANVTYQQGDYARAAGLAEQSLELYREQGNPRGIADCLGLLVELAMRGGKLSEAIAQASERVRLIRQVGELGEVADALYSLANMFTRHGETARGEALFQEALLLYRNAGNELGVATTLIMSATALWWLTPTDTAPIPTIGRRLQEALAIVSKLGSRYWIGYCSWLGALVALSSGETARADRLAQESLTIHREIGARWNVAWALHVRGRVEVQRNDLTAARSWYQQSLALALELGDKFLSPLNLEGLAGVVAAQGELIWAAQLWGAAETLREATDVPLYPVDRAGYEQALATARAQLGEQAFAAAWAVGRRMTSEQALAAQGPVTMPPTAPAEPSSVPHAPKAPTYPAGLTAREVEVLRLVAQGLTDAQVAEHLIISRRTVNWHLTSIYSKLQVSSRSAATRYAIEQHLL